MNAARLKTIEQRYTKLSEIEHVLKRPGRYVGSVNNHTAETWIKKRSVIGDEMSFEEVTWNPALIKIFDEILSNSVDESKRKGTKLNTIRVNISKTGITVRDNGGIPVVVHKGTKQYVPEMIFSELRAGSNFDDNESNFGTGQNGEGSVLGNIFSKSFIVKTSDGTHTFYQKFTNNMKNRTKPIIKKTANKNGYTEITFQPDYSRLKTSFSAGNQAKLIKRVYDVAGCNPKLKIILNGERLKFASFKKYIELYTEDYVFTSNKHWNVAFASSTRGFQHVSFVNSTETLLGGTHIDYVVSETIAKIRQHLEKKYKVSVKPSEIKNHLTVFIEATIDNPRYSSQTKDEMITEVRDFGTTPFAVPDAVIHKILKSDIIHSVLEWIEAKKAQAELAKLRKAKRSQKKRKVAEHIAANSKTREKCSLHICEGMSAITEFLNVRNPLFHGAYPLRGKPLNTRKLKNKSDILKNKELSDLMGIIGLSLGEPASDLNYGEIRIMTDADLDGKGSIAGLLVNFFSMWPELFLQKRIQILSSPIVIARKKSVSRYFYDLNEYVKASAKYKTWEVLYVKGLGSLRKEDYDEMINRPNKDIVEYDNKMNEKLEVVYGNDTVVRKEWLLT